MGLVVPKVNWLVHRNWALTRDQERLQIQLKIQTQPKSKWEVPLGVVEDGAHLPKMKSESVMKEAILKREIER